jgi:signal transduction histidine kinase
VNRVRRLSRIPIRLRLTLVFAVSMAVVLTATGGLLYQRLSGALDASLNNGLYARTADVGTRVRNGDTRLDNAAHDDEHFSQVLTDTGRQRAATPGLGEAFELPAAALHAAVGHRVILDGLRATGSDDRFRVLAEPVDTPTGRSVIVIAASLDPRAEVLAGLRAQLLLGGALALTLASLAGYAVAAAALRPVEAMRREAAAVSATEPGRRLPLPAADDEITRLGQTLNDMLGRLETVLAGERRFIAEASHELRTPLALLRTEVELALRRGRSAEELAQALRSVAEETDRLSRLAEDLLVLARGQGSRLTLRRERLAAGELLARVRERFAAQASAIGRELEVTGDDGAHLFADR